MEMPKQYPSLEISGLVHFYAWNILAFMQSEVKHWLKSNLAARKAVLFVIEIKLIYAL